MVTFCQYFNNGLMTTIGSGFTKQGILWSDIPKFLLECPFGWAVDVVLALIITLIVVVIMKKVKK